MRDSGVVTVGGNGHRGLCSVCVDQAGFKHTLSEATIG